MKQLKKTRGVWLVAGFVALWLCGFVASSCGDTQSEYSSRTCYFVFDNDAHLDPTLAAAMTPYSGVFTTVTQTMKGGARYFVFKSNQQTQSESIFNAIDTRRTLIMGMNDGLIVGYGVLSDPVTFYAYDRECPNCFDPNRIPIRSYALTTTSNGMAVCNTCKRKYDMNNGGNLVEGDAGKKLTRYRAATTGPYGKLSVN
jgi:hypothetical protein